MRLWQRLAGALKDKNSVWAAQLSRRTSFRNPDLEAAVIKATSHDRNRIDCKNVQRVFQWVRTSPLYLKPLIWALTMRMQKTRSWIVALKGLMLMHGIYCCDLAAVRKMGRLPFDLTHFCDEHLDPYKAFAYDAFVRSYFAYLDQKSAFVCMEFHKQSKHGKKTEETLIEELEKLQAMQDLIDMLLRIKPDHLNSREGLILEAMDCVIVELFDVYSKFCKGIARALLRIYDIGGKMEASVGLKVLQKAAIHSGQLSIYFDFCREIGVLNASQCPKMERFPEGYIQDLDRIINGVDEKENLKGDHHEEDKAIVPCVNAIVCKDEHKGADGLKTVITEKWEVFDDQIVFDDRTKPAFSTNPFEDSYTYSIVPYHAVHNQVLPDLISF
ncbi:hypothetical protein QN277_004803 [Acacia crassicarpa]|uniref:ENTH domain-containing protein n=1 Tax=Acacia crassicarpa TaxID=499986 RepID=A0AAE1ME54_9FABA|nr:hypothetical protein QN277_004803 [Acacia crassicarpa]